MNSAVGGIDHAPDTSYLPEDMPESPDVYTVEQVAERLQTTSRTVLRLVERGQLYGVRVGRFVRIPRAAYEAFLRGETYSPNAPTDTPATD